MINIGLINKTYIVEHLHYDIKSKFILQSLSKIFKSQDLVNTNHKLITDHINGKLNNNFIDGKRWEVPSLIRCNSNNLFSFTYESNTWRAMKYVEEATSLDSLEDYKMAYQTGVGLAKFHAFFSDFNPLKLKNSIEHFHNTRYYLSQYFVAIANYNFLKLDEVTKIRIQKLINHLSKHISFSNYLINSLDKEFIDSNVIHGDPKLNNFLFDRQCKYVVSLIDLDTVSSGYILTDLADCIRSICNLSGEDKSYNHNVYFDCDACRHFIEGYLSISFGYNITSLRLLPEFIYLIIFELTIRFLTDFLKSNKYFTIDYETHNLYRAEIQYRLLSSFLRQVPNLTNELYEIGIPSNSTFTSNVQKFI